VLDEKTNAYKLLDRFCVHSNKKLKKYYPKVIEYLESRGINEDCIDQYLIGYADDKNSLSTQLRYNKDDLGLAIQVGLVINKNNKLYDHFRNRIIIPVWNQGRIVFSSSTFISLSV